MISKKTTTILVILAIILAITAIVIQSNSDDVQTTQDSSELQAGSGQVGVTIAPPEIEDKLTGEPTQ